MPSTVDRLNDSLVLAKLIGRSPSFVKVIQALPTIARSQATALLHGETGTGKELIARAIHYLSPRAGFPFVAVNCGALPDTLLEDALFGHERAPSPTRSPRQGVIAQAERGTLFLDEIDSLSRKAQVALLRVLQERCYRPVGSSVEQCADVRIVTACNAPLDQLVRGDHFRTDLYYRLAVFTVQLPPLRERPKTSACWPTIS